MKKIIQSVSCILLSIMMLFGASGCFNTEDSFIEDGDFIYYNLKNTYMKEDCYAIVGTTEQGKEYKEDVYVPTYFRGKEVRYTSFTKYGAYGGVKSYALTVNCKNLYFNYIQKYLSFAGKAKCAFYPRTAEKNDGILWTSVPYTTSDTVYIGGKMYEYAKAYGFNSAHPERFEEIESNILKRTRKNNNGEITSIAYVMKANTSYLFNYEDAPNEGLFFINNFEWGGLIEDTPYDPIREGYTFGGWYKEPECINKWNFATDKLPVAEYDENGYVVNFVETKLYAKWIKS